MKILQKVRIYAALRREQKKENNRVGLMKRLKKMRTVKPAEDRILRVVS